MIKLLDILIEQIESWQYGFERPFKFDPNSSANEGRFRIFPPDELTKEGYYRSTKHPWTKKVVDGISYVMGKRKDNGKLTIQAIRFNKNIWNEDQAREWFEDNKNQFKFYVGQIDEGLNLQKRTKTNNEKIRSISGNWEAEELNKIADIADGVNAELFSAFATGGECEIIALYLPNRKVLWASNVNPGFYISPKKYTDPEKFYDDFWNDDDMVENSILIADDYNTPIPVDEIVREILYKL